MKRYEYLWRNKWICSKAKSIDDFITTFEQLAIMFARWKKLGIQLDSESGISDDYATFYIEDEKIAKQEGFELPFEDEK